MKLYECQQCGLVCNQEHVCYKCRKGTQQFLIDTNAAIAQPPIETATLLAQRDEQMAELQKENAGLSSLIERYTNRIVKLTSRVGELQSIIADLLIDKNKERTKER